LFYLFSTLFDIFKFLLICFIVYDIFKNICNRYFSRLAFDVFNPEFRFTFVFSFAENPCAFNLCSTFSPYCFKVRHHFLLINLDISLTNRVLKQSARWLHIESSAYDCLRFEARTANLVCFFPLTTLKFVRSVQVNKSKQTLFTTMAITLKQGTFYKLVYSVTK